MKLITAVTCLCCSVLAACASTPSRVFAPVTPAAPTAGLEKFVKVGVESPAPEHDARHCVGTRQLENAQGRCSGVW